MTQIPDWAAWRRSAVTHLHERPRELPPIHFYKYVWLRDHLFAPWLAPEFVGS